MNVLLIGGQQNFVFQAIVDKLLKENCSVYHVSGESPAKGGSVSKRVVTYNVALDDEYLSVVVKSISPDVIVFMGAFDDRHTWRGGYHRASAKYVSELTNALVTAADLNVQKFIYLSTINVYGFKNEGILDENTPLAPGNVKAIIVAQGEQLCSEFANNKTMHSVILRFGSVYGGTKHPDFESDYILNKCYSALSTHKLVENNQTFPLIFVDDAVIAVYKAISLGGDIGIFNVCDDETITDKNICDIIQDEYSALDIARDDDRSYSAQNYQISGKKFKEAYSFYQITKYDDGIRKVARHVQSNQAQLERMHRRVFGKDEEIKGYLRTMLKRSLPFLETLLAFAIFVLLNIAVTQLPVMADFDVMLVFVVLVSVTFGTQQSLISIILVLLQRFGSGILEGTPFVKIVTSPSFISSVLTLLLVGLITGHVRDRLQQRLKDSENLIERLENEHAKLNEINDVTVMIKQELEERMLASTDSLATVYSLVDELDSLVPADVFIRSIKAIERILKSRSISVYIKASDTSYRLAFWSDGAAKTLGSSIELRYLPEMNERFGKNSVFTNNRLDPNLPRLAAPLHISEKSAAIIMVWDLTFASTTVYHINLFATLIKLIENTLNRAATYRAAVNITSRTRTARSYLTSDFGAGILSHDEFLETVSVAESCRDMYGVPFMLRAGLTSAKLDSLLMSIRSASTETTAYVSHDASRGFNVIVFGADDNTFGSFNGSLSELDSLADDLALRLNL